MPSISKINMKKIISLNKKIEFPTMIGEVTAISLEPTLTFIDESNVAGDFIISGRYKMTEASRLEEDFNYKIPIEIILTEKIDLPTAKVDVEDFYYEIEEDDTMICYIDVKVEGVELIEDEREEITEEIPVIIENNIPPEEFLCEQDRNSNIELNEYNENEQKQDLEKFTINDNKIRECDSEKNIEMENNNMPKSEEIIIKEESNETSTKQATPENVGSLFSSFKDSDETFSTYSVYILRNEETVETILEKYKVTREELEKYNDLTNLSIGTKIIIPTIND